jgi:nucleoside-diphosphate-sugar epimerase
MKALIAGCGYVGTALAQRLTDDGYQVWGLRRSCMARRGGSGAATVDWIEGDLTDPRSLSAIPEGIEIVFYLAGADGYDEASYRQAYVTGPANLIRELAERSTAPRRIFFASSTGVYAQENGEWVDEDSPAEQTHFSGARLLEGERIVRQGPFPGTVVRFGGIYGPAVAGGAGRTRLIDSVREGSARRPPRPTYLNLIHRDDCAGILRHLMNLPNPDGLYLGVDCEPAERGELLTWIAQRLGVPPPAVAEADSASSARSMRGNKRCRNARLLRSGYPFAYPTYREGLEPLIAGAVSA